MTGRLIPREAGIHPPLFTPAYKTSVLRSPQRALIAFDSSPSEETGPTFGHVKLGALDNDLLLNYARPGTSAIGERIIVHGRLLDENNRPIPNALIEIWQANAGGRYRHKKDGYLAALDPDFGGCGRTITGEDGSYAFRTVKPGAYPWRNYVNSWRPAHIHVSVFGRAFCQRLITQLYFEGDPLIAKCPIVNTIPGLADIGRLVAALDVNAAIPFDSLAYKFDIVLRGRRSTLFENRLEGN